MQSKQLNHLVSFINFINISLISILYFVSPFEYQIYNQHRVMSYKKYTDTDERSNNPERHSQRYQQNQSEYQNQSYGSMQQSISKVATFEVQLNNLIPMTNKIKQENMELKEQKQKIEKQLNSLFCMSNMIKDENQAMMQHFKQRKIDLQQIVTTFTINNNEDINDLDHLTYSYREHNRMLNTQIDSLDKQIKSIQQNNQKLNKDLQLVIQQNLQLEKVIMFKQAHTQRNNKNLANGNKMMNTVAKLDQLEQQVADLCFEVGQIRSNNMKTINHLRRQQFQLKIENPNKTKQTVQKIKQKVYLNGQTERLNKQMLITNNKIDNFCQLNKQIKAKMQKVLGENEKKRIKINILCEKLRKTDEFTQQSVKNILVLKNQVNQKQMIKKGLEKQMERLEYLQFQNAESTKMKKMEIQKKAEKEINERKLQIQRSSQGLHNELSSNTFNMKRENQKKISNLRYELSILKNRSRELETLIQSMKDPMKDIILLENSPSKQVVK